VPAVTRIGLAFGAFGALLCVGGAAAADIRVWEEHPESVWKNRNLDITGYLQPGYIQRQDDPDGQNPHEDDNFWLQRARFGLRSRVHRFVWVRMEYDATVSQLEDGYLEARFLEQLNLRFGQFQIPFLKTFMFSEVNLAFNDRAVYTPLQQDRETLRYLRPRDLGFMLSGRVGDVTPKATTPVLEYWAGMFLGQGQGATNNIDDAYLYSARIQLHTLGVPDGVEAESDLARNESPRVGIAAGVYSNCDDRGQWNRGWTADAELRWQGVYVSGSFVWFKNGAASGLGETLGYGADTACGRGPAAGGPPDHIASGMSAQAQYVLPKFVPEQKHSFELLARFDQVNPQSPCNAVTGKCKFLGGGPSTPGYLIPASYEDADNPPTRYRITAGLNWFPDDRQTLRLSLNYQINREAEDVQNANGTFTGIKNDVIWFQATAGL